MLISQPKSRDINDEDANIMKCGFVGE